MTSIKPQAKLSLAQLFYLSLGGFGLQVASSLEMNTTSGIFKFLGASELQIGWLWLIAPVTGLLVQPLLGQLSDLMQTPYGKRSPFIFAGLVLASLALLCLCFTERLWWASCLILILSCSLNCATEGLRALVGDITPDRQKPVAFAWQAVYSSVGAMLASLLPWLLEQVQIFRMPADSGLKVPIIIKVSLLIGAFILAQSLWSTLRNIDERNIEQSLNQNEAVAAPLQSGASLFWQLWQELFQNLKNTPPVIHKLFMVQLFTWAGIFVIWLYLGIAIAQHIYGLSPAASGNLTAAQQQLLQNGVVATGTCSAFSQLFSIIYVLILPKLAERFSAYKIHALSLLIGAFSLISIVFMRQLWQVYVAMIGFGMLWGSLITLPYAIISAEIPPEKMGTYMGIFNLTITIPQIVCGLLIGLINQYLFFNHAILSIVLSGFLVGAAGILLLRYEGIDVIAILWRGYLLVRDKISRLWQARL